MEIEIAFALPIEERLGGLQPALEEGRRSCNGERMVQRR